MVSSTIIDLPPRRFEAPDVTERVADILNHVRRFRWSAVPDAGGSSAGMDFAILQRICHRWINGYDWEETAALLARFPQYHAEVEGVDIHFLHVRGSRPRPILLCHGWPGSVLEFTGVIERLAFPDRFGGRAEDGFDVIVPALPGYGYSSRPPAPLGPRATAALFNRLMTGCLGYPRYMAQGGDWGSAVTAWMAHDFPDQIIGLHLNMAIVLSSHVQEIEDGRDYLAHKQAIWAREGGYAIQQGTRPQSLAFAMADSPVGMMAWILDKFNCWSDQSEPDLFKRFPIDLLIGNVMLYLVTDSFATSTWMYKGFRNEASDRLPPNGKINVPTAFAAFPDPVFVPPPRAILEQAYNLCRLTPMERGGHFAAMEAPGPFAQDVTLFGRRIDFS